MFPSSVPVFLLLFPVALSLSGLSELLVTSLCFFSRVLPLSTPVFEFELPAALSEMGETELEMMSSMWVTGSLGNGVGTESALMAKRERRVKTVVWLCMMVVVAQVRGWEKGSE